MKKGKVLKLNFLSKVIYFTLANKIIIILTFCFIFGFLFGVIFFEKFDSVNCYISKYSDEFINSRLNNGYIKIFFDSLFESLIHIIVVFCVGTSMFGLLFIFPLIFLRGYFYSSIISYLYLSYGVKGIAINAIAILPFSILFIIAYLLCCYESLKFSLLLANQTFINNEYKNLSISFKNYCIKYSLILILIFISAIIDSIISLNLFKNLKLV